MQLNSSLAGFLLLPSNLNFSGISSDNLEKYKRLAVPSYPCREFLTLFMLSSIFSTFFTNSFILDIVSFISFFLSSLLFMAREFKKSTWLFIFWHKNSFTKVVPILLESKSSCFFLIVLILPILECHTLPKGAPYFFKKTISILFSTASSMASVDMAAAVVIIICSTFFAAISCFCLSFFTQKHSPTFVKYIPSEFITNFTAISPFILKNQTTIFFCFIT